MLKCELKDQYAERIVLLYGPPATGKYALVSSAAPEHIVLGIEDLLQATEQGESNLASILTSHRAAFVVRDFDALLSHESAAGVAAVLTALLEAVARGAKIVCISERGWSFDELKRRAELLGVAGLQADRVRFFGLTDASRSVGQAYLASKLKPSDAELGEHLGEEGEACVLNTIGTRFLHLHRVAERIVSDDMDVQSAVDEELRLPTMHTLYHLRRSDVLASQLWQVIKAFKLSSATRTTDAPFVIPYSQLLALPPFQGSQEKLSAFLNSYPDLFFHYGAGLPVGARKASLQDFENKPTGRTRQLIAPLELNGYVGLTQPIYLAVFDLLREDEDVQKEMWQQRR